MSQAWARTGRRWQAHGRGVGGWVSCPEPPRSGWAAPRRMETGGRRRRCFDVLLYRFCQKSSRNKKQTNKQTNPVRGPFSKNPPHIPHMPAIRSKMSPSAFRLSICLARWRARKFGVLLWVGILRSTPGHAKCRVFSQLLFN